MSEAAIENQADDLLNLILTSPDLSRLDDKSRVAYYKAVCDKVGLEPLTKPFEFISLNGKTVLYVKREATDQLRNLHKIDIAIVSREVIEGVYVVTSRATTPSGRKDESTGAVSLAFPKTYKNKKGEVLNHPKAGQPIDGEDKANAMMKAETKSKRRVTLSIIGLGLLDESEIEGITEYPDAPAVAKLEGPVATTDKAKTAEPAQTATPTAAPTTPASPQVPKEVVAPASAQEPAAAASQKPAKTEPPKAAASETGELMPVSRVKMLTSKMTAAGITDDQFLAKFGKPLPNLLKSQSGEVQAFIENHGK